MKQRIRLTESQLHNVIRKCINEVLGEYKNKDTKRFNETGDEYDLKGIDKNQQRRINRLHTFDGGERYLYHNKKSAKGLANLGYEHRPAENELDRDEETYNEIDDDQWLHDHPVDSRGYLYRNSRIPTFDNHVEMPSEYLSDYDE